MNNELRTIISTAGLFIFLYGWVGQQLALARHRTPDSAGPWLDWRFRSAKRDWFASEYGYRLYRWAGRSTLLGGLIMLAAWLL
jgi:hypothetical protein